MFINYVHHRRELGYLAEKDDQDVERIIVTIQITLSWVIISKSIINENGGNLNYHQHGSSLNLPVEQIFNFRGGDQPFGSQLRIEEKRNYQENYQIEEPEIRPERAKGNKIVFAGNIDNEIDSDDEFELEEDKNNLKDSVQNEKPGILKKSEIELKIQKPSKKLKNNQNYYQNVPYESQIYVKTNTLLIVKHLIDRITNLFTNVSQKTFSIVTILQIRAGADLPWTLFTIIFIIVCAYLTDRSESFGLPEPNALKPRKNLNPLDPVSRRSWEDYYKSQISKMVRQTTRKQLQKSTRKQLVAEGYVMTRQEAIQKINSAFSTEPYYLRDHLCITEWSAFKKIYHAREFGINFEDYGMTKDQVDSMRKDGVVKYIAKGGEMPPIEFVKDYIFSLRDAVNNPDCQVIEDGKYVDHEERSATLIVNPEKKLGIRF